MLGCRSALWRRDGPVDCSRIFVARRYRSRLLNFAAYSPEDCNATDRRSRFAHLERTGLKGLFQYIGGSARVIRESVDHSAQHSAASRADLPRQPARKCRIPHLQPFHPGGWSRRVKIPAGAGCGGPGSLPRWGWVACEGWCGLPVTPAHFGMRTRLTAWRWGRDLRVAHCCLEHAGQYSGPGARRP
jgi:hypothetical protein